MADVRATSPIGADEAGELALLIDSVSDYAIYLLDPSGHVRTWNRGAERIKGYTAAEVIGRHVSIFSTDEDRGRDHAGHILQVAKRDGRFEEEAWRTRKDGSRFWASVVVTSLHDADGRHIGFGKVTRDLTVRRLEQERLRAGASELLTANVELDLFRRLVLSVRDYAIFLLDPHGCVVTWNAGAEHLKGYSAEEIVGRHFSTFYTAQDKEREHPAFELETASREGRYEEEGWRIRKDGTRFWASVTITAVRGDAGELIGFAKVTRDLTTRREAEEAQRAAEQELRRVNEELDRFASVAAHDLTDPLRTISGFAELLERRALDAQAAEYTRHIRSTALRMTRLVDGLLEYALSGRPAEEEEPVGLAEAAQRVLAGLDAAVRERSAEVVVDIPADAVVCAGTADVELVLQNLIANGLKFGAADGPHVTVVARRVEDSWRLAVSDDGEGVALADQERIFTAFERAHSGPSRGGTGLGLAICERLVRRYGGAIGVESAAGQGATFWVLLPAPAATE